MSDTELPCPGCGRPMARVGGPGAHRGWTCVSCNAAGDPEEDHLEDPADSRPCGCEETEALKAERDTFRDLARHRGDLLVSEVERRLLAERRLALLVRIEVIVFEGSAHEQRLLDAAEQGGDPRAILYAGSVAFRRIREALIASKAGGS